MKKNFVSLKLLYIFWLLTIILGFAFSIVTWLSTSTNEYLKIFLLFGFTSLMYAVGMKIERITLNFKENKLLFNRLFGVKSKIHEYSLNEVRKIKVTYKSTSVSKRPLRKSRCLVLELCGEIRIFKVSFFTKRQLRNLLNLIALGNPHIIIEGSNIS